MVLSHPLHTTGRLVAFSREKTVILVMKQKYNVLKEVMPNK